MKRTFQILDEMNVADEQNKTATCGVCPDFIRMQTVKKGAEIVMGVPADVGQKIMFEPERFRAFLVVVDMDEYEKYKTP